MGIIVKKAQAFSINPHAVTHVRKLEKINAIKANQGYINVNKPKTVETRMLTRVFDQSLMVAFSNLQNL